jgi:hypothetical protein
MSRMQLALLTALLLGCRRQEVADPGTVAIQDFDRRVEAYVKLRTSVESNLPNLKTTPVEARISEHRQDLAGLIRESRKGARQGDIFTPEAAAEFRRRIGITMQSPGVRDSLKNAAPVDLKLGINDVYPESAPLQSSPPTLLLNLPRLPPDLSYRVLSRDLVLLDSKANLVLDFIPGAMP